MSLYAEQLITRGVARGEEHFVTLRRAILDKTQDGTPQRGEKGLSLARVKVTRAADKRMTRGKIFAGVCRVVREKIRDLMSVGRNNFDAVARV